MRAYPLCRMCQEQGRVTAAVVVDHIIPHKLKEALKSGNKIAIAKAQTLFWDKKNWQGLCVPHHSSTKQRMEKRDKIIGCDENGIPLDPDSHWFTSTNSK
ncbi:HNH endonuclease [Symbiopectobacterium sp.]|uniref:HNH endonuclease n=1 Tax=Symbiopectobacterium sp. TaxID=2952789 RepID=UPI003F2E68C2